MRPLKEFGNPIADLLEPKPYLALQSMFDPLVPHGWHRYWKSVELPPLTDDAIDTLIDQTSRITSPRSYTIILQLGGALARVAEDATAFGQRDAAHNVVVNAVWTEDDPDAHRHIAWARDFYDAMQPHARGPRLRQLPRRGGARSRPPGLRDREVRPAGRAQAQVRPHELLPPQPEHPADVADEPGCYKRSTERSSTKPKAHHHYDQIAWFNTKVKNRPVLNLTCSAAANFDFDFDFVPELRGEELDAVPRRRLGRRALMTACVRLRS